MILGKYSMKKKGREKHLLRPLYHSTVNSNANALSTSLLLVSYSTNVLKKIVGSSDNKEALLSKVRKYEGKKILNFISLLFFFFLIK
jgi:hypothetical protein